MNTDKLQQMENELARLNVELQRRSQEIEETRTAIEHYQAKIRRLNAASVLDRIDHSQEIAIAKAELAQITQQIEIWPDVQSELQRRIGQQQAEITRQLQSDRVSRLQAIFAEEEALRQVYITKALEFLAAADELHALIAQKRALHNQISTISRTHGLDTAIPNVGELALLTIHQEWPSSGNGVNLARRAWGFVRP